MRPCAVGRMRLQPAQKLSLIGVMRAQARAHPVHREIAGGAAAAMVDRHDGMFGANVRHRFVQRQVAVRRDPRRWRPSAWSRSGSGHALRIAINAASAQIFALVQTRAKLPPC